MALNFISPGAAAGNAIREQMLMRLKLERQAELDAQAKAEQEAQRQQQAAELAFRREQEARVAQTQQAQIEDLANQREFSRASTIAENAMPNDPADADTQAMLQRQGFGGMLRQIPGVLMQGPIESGDESMRAQEVGQTPDQTVMRGGSKFLNAEAQRQAAAELAGQAEAGRNERANADREMRQFIAAMAARGDAQAAALDRRMKEMQIKGEEDKQAAAATERDRAEKARTDTAQTALTLLDRLEQHPGFGMSYGNVSSRFAGFDQAATDAGSIRDQVVAALTLPNLGTLKGPMSDKDILFVKQLATRLQNPRISEVEARNAIAEARKRLSGGLPSDQGGAPAQGSGKGFRVVGVR